MILVAGLLFAGKQFGWAQGFVNLDFEAAVIKNVIYSEIPASNAIPGWTFYSNGQMVQDSWCWYDDFSLSGGAVSLFDTNTTSWGYNYPPIQGKYYVSISSFNYPGYEHSVGLGQTGQIPLNAQSLTLWGVVGANDLTFNGQTLPLTIIGNGANYNIYGADISAFAGQIGLLLFTTELPSGGDTIDNIQFSSSPVPEPAGFALAGLGTLLFSLRRQQKPFQI